MIRVKQETAGFLKSLKITSRESYDEVINRILLQSITEDQLELDEKLKKVLMKRLEKLKQGQVKSFDQILESVRKKEVAKMGIKQKGNDRGGEKYATMGS